jgi:predicted transcriptional regulator
MIIIFAIALFYSVSIYLVVYWKYHSYSELFRKAEEIWKKNQEVKAKGDKIKKEEWVMNYVKINERTVST